MSTGFAEAPDFESSQKGGTRIWVLAAIGAVAIHVACGALALAHLRTDEPEQALGARTIEIGLELSAPRDAPTDLPPGPDVEAAVASPAVAEQKAVVEQSELPKAVPTETDDPDRLVAPDDQHRPRTDDPQVATLQATPSNQSVAAIATAAPTSDTALVSPRSTAPVQGTGDSARRVRATWQRELLSHFDRHKRYPSDRSLRSAEVMVSFVLDRTGHILSAAIVKGSGDASFDEAALTMLRRSDPVPPPPPVVADGGLDFTLPVMFGPKAQN